MKLGLLEEIAYSPIPVAPANTFLPNVTNESVAISTSINSDEINVVDETRLPNPSELEDGTIMMVVGGHWVEYSFEDLYDMIIDKMNTEYFLNKI